MDDLRGILATLALVYSERLCAVQLLLVLVLVLVLILVLLLV